MASPPTRGWYERWVVCIRIFGPCNCRHHVRSQPSTSCCERGLVCFKYAKTFKLLVERKWWNKGKKYLWPKRCLSLGLFLSLMLSYTHVVIGIYLKIFISTISKYKKNIWGSRCICILNPIHHFSIGKIGLMHFRQGFMWLSVTKVTKSMFLNNKHFFTSRLKSVHEIRYRK